MTEKKVLLFDDEPFITVALGQNLKLQDFDVVFVSEVDSLFEEISNNIYDIIILDIMAPIPDRINEHVIFTNKEILEMDGGMNTGVVIAEKIWNEYTNIPILFLSAKSPRALASISPNNCNRIFAYLRKPQLVIDICNKLYEMLNSIKTN